MKRGLAKKRILREAIKTEVENGAEKVGRSEDEMVLWEFKDIDLADFDFQKTRAGFALARRNRGKKIMYALFTAVKL